jgi:hypothetical protein
MKRWSFGTGDAEMDRVRSIDSAPLDEIDTKIADSRMAEFDRTMAPRLGDIVRFDDERGSRRLSVITERGGFQTCAMTGCSFHLSGPSASPSGSMDFPVLGGKLEITDETQFAPFWIFHHGSVGVGRARYFFGRVRVYRYTA